jgi:large subunit ribosomal protein L3
MLTIYGFKRSIAQRFTRSGHRVPVTVVDASTLRVAQVKTPTIDGYWAVQLAIGAKRSNKHLTQPIKGHLRGAPNAPLFFREVRLPAGSDAGSVPTTGEVISSAKILSPGDLVSVSGNSKGKGFAGVVKRYHFAGGPRTHGQSDRERSPGSSGSTTTPGRVYRGKRRAGRLGNDRVTIRNLTVLSVSPEGEVLIAGVVPGPANSLVALEKTGKTAKRFEPLTESGGGLDRAAIVKEQQDIAQSVGSEEKESKTAEAIRKAMEAQKGGEQP